MRRLFVLLFSLSLFTGCAVSSINVLEQKETLKPFSKLMVVYINNDIDFSVFDSLTYNICVKPGFLDTAGLRTRGTVEELLYDGLSSPGSTVFKASDIFTLDFNSYNDFTREMDSQGIDALLLIHLHQHAYAREQHPNTSNPLETSGAYSVKGGSPYRSSNAVFACYLIKTHEYLPVWKAEIDVKGKAAAQKGELRPDMIGKLEKSLVTGGYLTPAYHDKR